MVQTSIIHHGEHGASYTLMDWVYGAYRTVLCTSQIVRYFFGLRVARVGYCGLHFSQTETFAKNLISKRVFTHIARCKPPYAYHPSSRETRRALSPDATHNETRLAPLATERGAEGRTEWQPLPLGALRTEGVDGELGRRLDGVCRAARAHLG